MADAARAAIAHVRARQANAVADLFLPAADRLREDDRATIARLLAELVERIEQALRTRLAATFGGEPTLAEALGDPASALAGPVLERTGALRDPLLIATLARRALEGRTAARLRLAQARAAELDPDERVAPLDTLCRDADGAVADAASRLDAAERGRIGPGGMPLLAVAEVPAELQHRLVWRIAAALRDHIAEHHAITLATLDRAIAAAAGAVLAGYDEGDTLPGLALALARALWATGQLDDGLIGRALDTGHVGFAVAALAVRADIGFDAAWDMAFDPGGERLLPLCRAADLSAAAAAGLAIHLLPDQDDEALADRIDGYRTSSAAQAAAALAPWRLDPAYLEALAARDQGVSG